ncbi:hypothetical protein BGZ97_009402, partial [Linnemannia gamsii]
GARPTLRFTESKNEKGQPFQVIADPHLFLDPFKTYCESSYGEKQFLMSATRLLRMAILDEQTRQQFNDEMVSRGTSAITWDECEVAFVDSVLTPTERFSTVARVAEIGRRVKESYRNFALRLQRSVRVYRIDDNNTTVLSGIMGSRRHNAGPSKATAPYSINAARTHLTGGSSLSKNDPERGNSDNSMNEELAHKGKAVNPVLEAQPDQELHPEGWFSLSEVKLDLICDVLTALSLTEGPYNPSRDDNSVKKSFQ